MNTIIDKFNKLTILSEEEYDNDDIDDLCDELCNMVIETKIDEDELVREINRLNLNEKISGKLYNAFIKLQMKRRCFNKHIVENVRLVF